MKQIRLLMGMPITVEIVDVNVNSNLFDKVYDYFEHIDKVFSTYKPNSEISKINKGLTSKLSSEMTEVLALCKQTSQETGGYFDITHDGKLDPSGLVKGWAIQRAAQLIDGEGFKNFYIDAGGDIQVSGKNSKHLPWRAGIRNPFNRSEIIKVIKMNEVGVATSGTYIRGQHVYDPYHPHRPIKDIVAITVIGPNIYEADRFATAAFAMGRRGINFIEKLKGFEAYMVDSNKKATATSGFGHYEVN